MLQLLTFNQPIPSCSIYGLEYDNINKTWKFIYAVNTPFELTNENEKELIIYEYISDLIVKESDNLHPESINIRFKTLDEYLSLLNKQISEDKKFRENWKSKHPNAIPATLKLENKNYNYSDLIKLGINYIASIENIDCDNNFTIFAGI